MPLDRRAQLFVACWAGSGVLPRVTKAATALIVAGPTERTGNDQKAQEHGIPIIAERDFLAAVGVTPEAIGQVTRRWARATSS